MLCAFVCMCVCVCVSDVLCVCVLCVCVCMCVLCVFVRLDARLSNDILVITVPILKVSVKNDRVKNLQALFYSLSRCYPQIVHSIARECPSPHITVSLATKLLAAANKIVATLVRFTTCSNTRLRNACISFVINYTHHPYLHTYTHAHTHHTHTHTNTSHTHTHHTHTYHPPSSRFGLY